MPSFPIPDIKCKIANQNYHIPNYNVMFNQHAYLYQICPKNTPTAVMLKTVVECMDGDSRLPCYVFCCIGMLKCKSVELGDQPGWGLPNYWGELYLNGWWEFPLNGWG